MNRSRLKHEPSRPLTPLDFNSDLSNSFQTIKPHHSGVNKNALKSFVSNSTLKSDSTLPDKRQPASALDQRRPSTQSKTSSTLNRSLVEDRMPTPDGSPHKQSNLAVSFFQIQRAAMKNQLQSGLGDSKANIAKMLSTSVVSTSSNAANDRFRSTGGLIQKIEEKYRAAEVNKQVAKESTDCKEKRKEIEDQVLALETRIAKLRYEEDEVMKKVQKVRDDAEKTMENRRRREEDIRMKEEYYRQKQEEMRRKREKATNNRMNIKAGLQHAKVNNLENKHYQAQDVKEDNNNFKALKMTLEQQKNERNRMLIRRVSEQHELVKAQKIEKEISGMNKFTEKSVSQMTKDKEAAEKLAKRYQELVDYEQEMLERLGRTYELHKSQVYELEQLSVMRVDDCYEDRIKPYKQP